MVVDLETSDAGHEQQEQLNVIPHFWRKCERR